MFQLEVYLSYSLFAPSVFRTANAISCLLATIALGAGCFAQTSEPPPNKLATPTPVAVTLAPNAATVNAGASSQLKATVTGTTNLGVTWSLSPAIGTLSGNGLYKAPAPVLVPTRVTVTATSVADKTKKASVVLTLSPLVSVSVTPVTATVASGRTIQLNANVSGIATNQARVTWSLRTSVGTLSTSGNIAIYAAPANMKQSTTIEAIATSVVDPTKTAKAVLSVVPLAVLTTAPAKVNIKAGKTQQFQANFTGGPSQAVTWSMEPAGIGTLTQTGLYTAPGNVIFAQQVKIKATSKGSPTLNATSEVIVLTDSDINFTLNNNGLETLLYKGTDYNYKYGEGLLASVRYGNDNVFKYGPPCSRTLSGSTLSHQCMAGPVSLLVKANHAVVDTNTISVEITVTNQSSTETLREANISVLGIRTDQFNPSESRTILVDSNAPVGVVNYVRGRYFYWLDSPGRDVSLFTNCSGTYICKIFPRIADIAPGGTKTIRVFGRYTEDLRSPFEQVVPEAYTSYTKAFPTLINWPDRRPIMAWWIADGGKRSANNPRGYLQDPAMNASDINTFRQRVVSQAVRIRTMMDARPVRPQGILIWDLEGQEFIHPTTYIGDPRVFESGYAPEMNAAADEVFKTFRDSGYRVGVTIRPSFLQWGKTLPMSCTYDESFDFKSYYVKVDNPFGQRFHACYDKGGKQWSVAPNGTGGQTMYRNNQIEEVTQLLKSKIRYAHDRWGSTLFYIDSAVWSGGRPLEATILRELQKAFPDSLFIPEQETMETMSTAIPFTDPRVSGDAKTAPLPWRWAYPTGAFAVAIGDCQGVCWQDNVSLFVRGQKTGDIALYAQPAQMNAAHLSTIEAMIQQARRDTSSVTIRDVASGAIYNFRGDVTRERDYPVKIRVYFGTSAQDIDKSQTYCEAGQWLGENSCNINLTGAKVAQIRYYDHTNTLVRKAETSTFR